MSAVEEEREHRCDGMEEDTRIFYFDVFSEWWIENGESQFAGIKFCPFCGEELK